MTCGAKTRAGTPCQQKAIFANGRCKWHGGAAPAPRPKPANSGRL
ncbi:HGGxSTG domain-containing protein [Methylomonas koyamae]